MNILQISAPKSGSFWLNTILSNILEKKSIPVGTFIEKQAAFQQLKNRKLSFKEQTAVDMMDIEEDGFFYRVSSILKEPIEDLEVYTNAATLAWTHSTWCTKSQQVFDLFDRKVCIVRDPRDRALSSAKFAFTPYMQEHYPTSYSSPDEYFSAEYENLLEQWVWFYGNYLLHKEELDLHFVFYENLLHNFDDEFQKLLNYLNLQLKETEKREISEKVAFSTMKAESPRHLNKGKSQKWVNQLDLQQQQRAVDFAGDIMKILNYPLTPKEGGKLPAVPENLPKEALEGILKKIDWHTLY